MYYKSKNNYFLQLAEIKSFTLSAVLLFHKHHFLRHIKFCYIKQLIINSSSWIAKKKYKTSEKCYFDLIQSAFTNSPRAHFFLAQ